MIIDNFTEYFFRCADLYFARGQKDNLVVTTVVYDDVYTVAERSCCDDLGIVTLIYSVDIASSIVTVFLDKLDGRGGSLTKGTAN
jgi:hypothetical protein